MTANTLEITEGSRVIVEHDTGGQDEGTVTGVGTTDDGLQMQYTVRVLHDTTEREDVFDAAHVSVDDSPTLLDRNDAAQLRDELRDIITGPYTAKTGISSSDPHARLRAATKIARIASDLAWLEINTIQFGD